MTVNIIDNLNNNNIMVYDGHQIYLIFFMSQLSFFVGWCINSLQDFYVDNLITVIMRCKQTAGEVMIIKINRMIIFFLEKRRLHDSEFFLCK